MKQWISWTCAFWNNHYNFRSFSLEKLHHRSHPLHVFLFCMWNPFPLSIYTIFYFYLWEFLLRHFGQWQLNKNGFFCFLLTFNDVIVYVKVVFELEWPESLKELKREWEFGSDKTISGSEIAAVNWEYFGLRMISKWERREIQGRGREVKGKKGGN